MCKLSIGTLSCLLLQLLVPMTYLLLTLFFYFITLVLYARASNKFNKFKNVIIVTEEYAKFSVCESEIQVKMT